MSSHKTRLARALEWSARLPLLGEPELARLLGIDAADAPRVRLELERRGWIEWFVPGTYALRQRRLSFVREGAVAGLARALRIERVELPRHVAVRRTDVLDRIVRVEITAWVNRFFADLAVSPGLPRLELADARSLPLALSVHERWWPPGVDGYGCLRAGELWAPFFVAWDRVSAPDEHRRRRVAAWTAAAPEVGARWGPEGLPVVLLVCAGEQEEEVWERSLRSGAERVAERRLDVLLTSASDVASAGPAAVNWRDPVSGRSGPLLERLGWGTAPKLRRWRLPDDAATRTLPRTGRTLRDWAPDAAADSRTPVTERVGAIAMTTDRDEKRLLEWIGRHPLLTSMELAGLCGVPKAAVARRLDWLVRCGVVRVDAGEASARRFMLTQLGLRLLARRDAVPPARYVRFAGVRAFDSGPSDDGDRSAVRHREHHFGVNRVFARLAQDLQRAGGRLALRRNEAESTRRFRYEGGAAWIRPDGSGLLELDGERLPFLLEYDRGTLDGGDFAAKFGGYRRYFAAEAWRQDFDGTPALLFVCADDRAEQRVASAVCAAAPDLPVLSTIEWRYEHDARNLAGLLGPIWREAGTGGVSREVWPRPRNAGPR
jgi:DNA-binding MarR family transcriptional regulator